MGKKIGRPRKDQKPKSKKFIPRESSVFQHSLRDAVRELTRSRRHTIDRHRIKEISKNTGAKEADISAAFYLDCLKRGKIVPKFIKGDIKKILGLTRTKRHVYVSSSELQILYEALKGRTKDQIMKDLNISDTYMSTFFTKLEEHGKVPRLRHTVYGRGSKSFWAKPSWEKSRVRLTRREYTILKYIQKHGYQGLQKVSKDLNITTVSANTHLSLLRKKGFYIPKPEYPIVYKRIQKE